MIGRIVAQYEIVERLGAGGMGEVFKARDRKLNRFVALKVLPQDACQDEDRRARFLQEARAASALNHPNIITVHDVLSDESFEYLVLEYVAGRSLADLTSTPRPSSSASSNAASTRTPPSAGSPCRTSTPPSPVSRKISTPAASSPPAASRPSPPPGPNPKSPSGPAPSPPSPPSPPSAASSGSAAAPLRLHRSRHPR